MEDGQAFRSAGRLGFCETIEKPVYMANRTRLISPADLNALQCCAADRCFCLDDQTGMCGSGYSTSG